MVGRKRTPSNRNQPEIFEVSVSSVSLTSYRNTISGMERGSGLSQDHEEDHCHR